MCITYIYNTQVEFQKYSLEGTERYIFTHIMCMGKQTKFHKNQMASENKQLNKWDK